LTDVIQVDKALSGVDIIIQAAATTSGVRDIVSQPDIHVTDNVLMNSLLFRSAFKHRLDHVVFFSCTVMLQSSDLPQIESDFDANKEIHPRYFGAGWTKIYLEKMCEFYSRLGNTKFTAIRHSNIYGPHDKFDLERSHVFGATITKVMISKGNLTVWGTGEEARDFLYVDDIFNMVSCVINKQKKNFEVYNCGTGTLVTIKDLVNRVILLANKSIAVYYDLSMPSIGTSVCLNYDKAQKEVGWRPNTSLDEGIKRTINWWLENIAIETIYNNRS
jgi:nucleoside-diphosphate-sugar epimerase